MECWGGYINHKSLFKSVIPKDFSRVKIWICGLNYHPSNALLLLAIFSEHFSEHLKFLLSLQGSRQLISIIIIIIFYNTNTYLPLRYENL